MIRFRVCASVLFATVLICIGGLSGCGQGDAVAQVRGKIVFKSGTMPPAGVRMVRLEPAADSPAVIRKGATGSINDDGTFEVYTRRPGDGVYLGKYDVTFTFLKSPTDQEQMLAAKYTLSKTTPYHLTVDRDIDELEFELEAFNATPE
jgi:hypothetical protein